jgi:hypothetical protein
LYNLYDAIGSLAESLGESIRNEKILNALMPPLIAKWNVLKDNDRSLCPLLGNTLSLLTSSKNVLNLLLVQWDHILKNLLNLFLIAV